MAPRLRMDQRVWMLRACGMCRVCWVVWLLRAQMEMCKTGNWIAERVGTGHGGSGRVVLQSGQVRPLDLAEGKRTEGGGWGRGVRWREEAQRHSETEKRDHSQEHRTGRSGRTRHSLGDHTAYGRLGSHSHSRSNIQCIT